MNSIDRFARALLGALLVLISPAGFDLLDGSVVSWFCLVFGLTNLVSAVFGWCFMYSLVGLSSILDTSETTEDDLIQINYESLRRKAVIGFGAVALLISTLYILEGYDSTKKTIHRMELGELHDISNLLSEEITRHVGDKLEGTDSVSSILTTDLLKASLYHFDYPMLVAIYDAKGLVTASKHLSPTSERALQTYLETQAIPKLKQIEVDDHHTELTSNEVENAFIDTGDALFGWNYHAPETLKAHPAWVLVFRKSNSQNFVFDEIIVRFVISSVLVIWLSIWGAVAVAFFIWKHVELSNRRALKAANTDPETGFLNERALKERVSQIDPNNPDSSYRVVAVKFRNLPDIVSNNGSAMVSLLLHQLASQLSRSLSPNCTLARLNSGNLLMIARESDNMCFDKFRELINETQLIDEYQFSLEPTEVVINYPGDVNSFDKLTSAISILIFNATQMRTPILHYNESLIRSSDKVSQYAAEIRTAIESKQFELFLQPKVNPFTQEVAGAEALIRWNHPEDGLLTPHHFLDIVKRSNVRTCFARFVITEAARLYGDLKHAGYNIPISFNLDGYDVLEPEIHLELTSIAQQLGDSISGLELELTETETSIHVGQIKANLRIITDLGYRIALDDFGTGMSSLSYTHTLPIDTIKIDKSFIDQLTDDPESRLPIKSILFIAESYGYQVVVEGVETEAQLEILKQLGCQLCQGYHFAKPMPYNAFLSYIQ